VKFEHGIGDHPMLPGGRGMSSVGTAAGTPGRVQQSPPLRALCDGTAPAHRAALHLVTKEVIALANGALHGEGGPGRGGAPSPRPPLSPSNFNAATSPSPTTPAGGTTRRSKRRPGSVGAAQMGHGEGGQRPLSATSGASPIAPDVLRSPRDPMNIAHLLSSSRSPWSPRHFGGRGGTGGPPQMTNRFHEGSSLAKPRTQKGKKALPQSDKKVSADSSASARMEPSSQSSYRALLADLTRAARVEEQDEGDDVQISGDELGADGGDGDVVTAGSVGHLPVQLFVAAIGACVLMVPKPLHMAAQATTSTPNPDTRLHTGQGTA